MSLAIALDVHTHARRQDEQIFRTLLMRQIRIQVRRVLMHAVHGNKAKYKLRLVLHGGADIRGRVGARSKAALCAHLSEKKQATLIRHTH